MKQNKINGIIAFLFVSLLLAFSSCAGVKYNAGTIDHAQSVNKQADKLLEKATTSFSANTAEIQSLKDVLQQDIAYEKTRGKTNVATINMWKAINGYLTNDFLNTWSNQGKLSQPAVDELKKRVDKLFQYISELEGYKKGGPLDK